MTAPIPRLAVSTCLIREGSVLLVERGQAPFKGLLSLPGGRVEFGETLEAAARREVAEETGVDIMTPRFHRFHEAIGADFHTVIAVHRAALPDDAVPVAGDDAAALRLVAIETVADLEARGETTPGLTAIVLSAARTS